MIRFTVEGKPLGANHAYAPARWGKRHGFRKTDEAKAWQARIALAAKRAMREVGATPILRRAGVHLVGVYETLGSDIDGPIKLVLDAIAKGAGVVENDNRIRRLVVDKPDPDGRPRIEVAIYDLEREIMPAELTAGEAGEVVHDEPEVRFSPLYEGLGRLAADDARKRDLRALLPPRKRARIVEKRLRSSVRRAS